MSTNESGPPDDGGGAPAYGAPPIPAVYDYTKHVVPGTAPEDIPIFTTNDVVEMLDRAQEKLQQTTHTVYHKIYTNFRDEVEKKVRAALSAEMSKFYRSRGLFR